MPRTPSLPPDVLEAALAGLEAQRQRLEEQIASVRRMLGARAARALVRPVPTIVRRTASATPEPTRKRTMSAAARRRIAAAQKKRWAEFHKKQKAIR